MRLSPAKLTALLACLGASGLAFGTVQATGPGSTTTPTTTTAAGAPTTAVAPTTAAAPTTEAGATTAPGAPTTTIPGATTVAGAPTTTTAGAAAGELPAGATLDQITAAISGVFGPSTDVAGELAPFVTPPPGIPTPEGAFVEEFSIHLFPDTDPARSYYLATLLYTTTVPATEMVPFFQTGMPAAGYVQTGDSVQNEDGRQIRWLTYDVAQPVSDNDEIEVAVVDQPGNDPDFVQLDISYGFDAARADVFNAWATDIPLVSAGTMRDPSINTFTFGSDISVSLSNGYDLPLVLADAQAQFDAGVAQSPYTLDPDSNTAEGFYDLTGGAFDTVSVYISEGFEENTSNMSVRGSFEIPFPA